MTMPTFFSEKYQSCVRSFESARNAVRREVLGQVEYNRRYFPAGADKDAKKISIEDLYNILNYDPDEKIQEATQIEEELEKQIHSESDREIFENEIGEHLYIPEYDYFDHITNKSKKYGIEEHILIQEVPEEMMSDKHDPYREKYIITIKNLTIEVGSPDISLKFDKIDESKEEDLLSKFFDKGGIRFVFESNSFVSLSSPDLIKSTLYCYLGWKRFLDFKINKFESINMVIETTGEAIVDFMGNYLSNSKTKFPDSGGVTISAESIIATLTNNTFNVPLRIRTSFEKEEIEDIFDNYWYSPNKRETARRLEKEINEGSSTFSNQYIKGIKNKIKGEKNDVNIKDILRMLVYMNEKIIVNPDDLEYRGRSWVELIDNKFFSLEIIAHECHFNGENIINKLSIDKKINYLHWEPHQSVDPKGEYAHENKQVFMELIERAAQNNDKMLEARLRRELMKCQRTLLRKEKIWPSLQDRLILWWSDWISDYGISWFYPILWLVIMNALLTGIILCVFDHNSSWWVLFAQFFNPLSDLATTLGIEKIPNFENKGWVASINISQKGLLAVCYYEMIKIFRRFSK